MIRSYVLTGLLAIMVMTVTVAATTPNDVMTFDSVNVIRIAPETLHVGEETLISVIFENTGSSEKTIRFVEWLPDEADFDRDAAIKTVQYHNAEGWYCPEGQCDPAIASMTSFTTESYNYEWLIRLPPGERTIVSYWLIPKSAGDFSILPATVTINGKEYWFHGKIMEVTCNADGRCDTGSGENYLSCPADCPSGGKDNICTLSADNRCDPDCAAGTDPDCGGQAILIAAGMLVTGVVVVGAFLYLKKKKQP